MQKEIGKCFSDFSSKYADMGKDEQSYKKDGCFSSVSPNCQSHITGGF
jgi:hypothetical protein